ncbi:MAG: hypothetical protein O3A00_28405 [Planctomycetota bacterium]|nr:hypothetical protein [Planctomycetota bacterium]
MAGTIFQADTAKVFSQLKEDWKTASRYMSNPAQMAILWPYQQIIGLGPRAIPLLLAELQQEPDHWFWALEAITGANPVVPEAVGHVKQMAEAWIEWGTARGLVDDAA